MAKKKKIFFCDECGFESVQWLGKCPQCNAWNSFKEMTVSSPAGVHADKHQSRQSKKSRVQSLTTIELPTKKRLSVGSAEFDRVLGGGVVPHTSILFTGEPGIGKSTLLLQTCEAVATQTKRNVLYITAEESLEQIRARSVRLGIHNDLIYVVAESDYDKLFDHVRELEPVMVIVDSVQAVYDPAIPSAPGSVTQVREISFRFNQLAKEYAFVLFLIGHVTKDGMLAGPRTLEHLVDVVVYFEGDRYQSLRMVRTIKNRYGETGEIGIFEMKQEGLCEIANPSSIFLSDSDTTAAGRATVPVMEGRRPFLVEVQALTNKTSFNNPVRRALGVEGNKLSLLLAVIERSLGLNFSGSDVFVKAVGGLKLAEAACDLSIILAIISSYTGISMPAYSVALGEVGLGGEIRKVNMMPARIKEASRLGFKSILLPKKSTAGVSVKGIEVHEVSTLQDVYALYFQSAGTPS